MTDVRFNALLKGAFQGEDYAHRDVSVSLTDSTVRVWDEVAGHYTTCHALTAGQIKRLRSAPIVRQAREGKR